MNIVRKLLGPKSKYDKTIPYTYVAKVQELENESELVSHYFSDTICGLVEYLDLKQIEPQSVKIFGLFRKEEIELESDCLVDSERKWLKRPDICKSLENTYKNTLEKRYKGHVEKIECSYEDRNRSGSGPF